MPCFCRSIQVQDEEEISVELIEERERAIRQLEVCEKKTCMLFLSLVLLLVARVVK